MARLLLTAFEPFDTWPENSAQLCLREILRAAPRDLELLPRILPVDFAAAPPLLYEWLAEPPEAVLHLGQAAGGTHLALERFAVNVGLAPGEPPGRATALVADGPAAYGSACPLAAWAEQLEAEGIPARVSFHAGTYLCNAVYYWSCHERARRGLAFPVCFVHLPLATSQVLGQPRPWPGLPVETLARAVLWLARRLALLAGPP